MKFGNSIMKVLARPTLKMKKYSPEILVVGGVVGVVTAAIMAVRTTASIEYQAAIDTHHINLAKMTEAKELAMEHPTRIDENGNTVETYSLEAQRKDVIYEYKKITCQMTKMYWPSVTLMTLSIVAILSGFQIIRKRNMALVAAYNIVDQAFRGYRERVRNELGEDMDTHFLHDTELKSVTKTIKNEDGTTTKIKETEQVLKGEVVSMYGRLYDSSNSQFERDPRFNWLYIKKKRDYFNDILHSRGHVFLNEIYEELGFEHTSYGAVVGWVANKKGGTGDNYISFGHWCEKLSDVEEAGPMESIILDFNVDGVVYDLI